MKRGDEVLEDVFVSGATANCVDIENRDVASDLLVFRLHQHDNIAFGPDLRDGPTASER